MQIQVIKYNRLHALAEDVLAVYYVARSRNGATLQLTKLKEEDDGDSTLAIKQIAVRATEDVEGRTDASLG